MGHIQIILGMSLNCFVNIMSTEQKKSKPKYKYGERYLDLNKYILNLDKNFQSYLNSRNWNEAQKQEFVNAFGQFLQAFKDQATNNTDRFYTNYAGSIFDKEGVFSNDDSAEVGTDYYNKRGKSISSEDYNSLKDRKKKKYSSFDANREVASYFNRVAKSMPTLEEEKTPSIPAFNIRNNGFLKWWNDQVNPSGSQIDNTPYLEKDALNADNTRGTTERAKYLREQLQSYIDQLGDYNFENSTFKSKENYVAKLQAAIKSLENGYDSNAQIALRAAGIGDEFNNGFFSTGEKKELPDPKQQELIQKEEEIKKQKEQKELEDRLYNLKRDEFFSSISPLENPITGDITTFSEYENDTKRKVGIEGTLNGFIKSYNLQNLPTNDQQTELKRILESKFPYIVGELRKRNVDKVIPYLNALHAIGSFGTPDGDGYVIIPNSVDLNRKSYIAYHPILGKYEERLLDLSKDLQSKMAYDAYDRVSKKQEGGSIESLGQEFWNQKKAKETEVNTISKEVKETGKSEKEVIAEHRKPSEELSGVDITRLTTAGMDIASMISSFFAGYGTIASAGLGLTSTIANIGADIADDSMSAWDTTKNALFGLGMDVLGLIPGWGASGKTTKIIRVLKPVAKTALAIMSGMGMVNSYNAFTKMINNPSEMTVADWRDALAGIKAITGAARSKGTTVSRNRELERNQVVSNYVNIPVKSGKSVKMSEEQFRRLKKAKGIEEQNKILKEVAPDEELGTEFISGKFNRLRHLGHRNPNVEKGTDYTQMDWSQREYLPTGYTYDTASGQVVPKKWSNAWLMNKVDRMVSSDSEDNSFGLFREKNPLYNKTPQPTVKPQKPSQPTKTRNFDNLRKLSSETKPLTKKEISIINNERKRQGKSPLTDQEIQNLNARRIERGNKQQNNSIKSRLAQYKKDKVLGKYNTLEDDVKRATDELFIAEYLRSMPRQYHSNDLNRINTYFDNYNAYRNFGSIPQYNSPLRGAAYNSRQKMYERLFALRRGGIIQKYAGGNPVTWRPPKYLKQKDTAERASDVNTWDDYYYLDKMFEDLSSIKGLNAKDLVTTLNSLDKIQKDNNLFLEKKPDTGYSKWNQEFHKTRFNEFFGYNSGKEDWLGPTTYNRQAFLKYLQGKGPIDINGTKISYNKDKGWVTDETPAVETPAVVNTGDGTARKGAPAGDGTATGGTTTGSGTAEDGKRVDQSKKNSNLPKPEGGYNNPLNNTLLYGLPRAIAADIINRRMTQMSIDNERPFLRDPLEFRRSIIGDIDALFRGQKSYANVRNFANKMTTSDADLQKAMQLEGELKGQEYLQQGVAQNNAQLRASQEQAWQQEKENTNNRWNIAMQNRLSMLQTLSNIYKYRQAEMAKSFDNWDRFWQQMEYDAKQKEQEKKQYVDYFKKKDIQNDIANNLAKLDSSVSQEGAELYKQVKQGLLNPSSITDANQLTEFRKAFAAAQKLEEEALKKYYGIYKKGGKVDTSDIDRFHEQIQKSIDRNEKLLDRLSKSLYGYIKQQLK